VGLALRFIHTADWHIDKVFGFLDDEATVAARDARLDAITTIGRLAREQAAPVVLVAGDVFDHDRVGDLRLDQPLERMRAFPGIAWHLIPGNHDPDRPGGVWERIARRGLPENVHLHRSATPVAIADGAWLLPAPLQRKHTLCDPTLWMDGAATAAGALRIGLAHGPVLDFGGAPGSAANRIAADRAEAARLDYLALGDRHATLRLGARCWYAGTPEADGFEGPASGAVLLVDLPGPGAPPEVLSLATGRFHWHREAVVLHHAADVDLLEERLRAHHPDPACLLVRLEVEGTLSLADRLRFDERIGQRLRAALRALDLRDRLITAPSIEDLDRIAPGGVVRAAAERLARRMREASGEEQAIAQQALLRLCVEQRRHAP
jgi:hypothetical protein